MRKNINHPHTLFVILLAFLFAGCGGSKSDTPVTQSTSSSTRTDTGTVSGYMSVEGSTDKSNITVVLKKMSNYGYNYYKIRKIKSESEYTTTTDERGFFSLPNVIKGNYVLFAEKDSKKAFSDYVYVRKNDVYDASLTLTQTGYITGTVKDVNGNPVQSAKAFLQYTSYSTTTDQNGSFTLSNVPRGRYSITSVKDDYYSSSEWDINVTATSNPTVNITLQKRSTSANEKAENVWASAMTYINTLDFSSAIEEFKKILSNYKDDETQYKDDAQLYIAQSYKELDRCTEAITEYQKYIETYSTQYYDIQNAYFGIAFCYYNNGDKESAKATLNKYENTRTDNEKADAQYNIAWFYNSEFEDYEEALTRYKKALANYPTYQNASYAQYSVAQIYDSYLETPDTDTAISEYTKVITNYPNSYYAPNSHERIASIYHSQKKYSSAIAEYKKLIANYSTYHSAAYIQRRIGDIYAHDLKDYNTAITEYRKVITNYPWAAPEAYNNIANVYNYYLKDYSAAITELKTLVANYPKHYNAPDAQRTIADIYQYNLKSYVSALTEYQKLAANYPTYSNIDYVNQQIQSLSSDSDGDGFNYAQEMDAGTDPNNANSHSKNSV